MKKHIFLFAILCLSARSAQGIIYTDRPTFTVGAPPLATETFDSLVGTLNFPNNYPNGGTGYYTPSINGIRVLDLVRYVGFGDFGFETYILGNDVATGAYSLNGTFALTGGRTQSTVYLPMGITAFGADFGAVGAATGGLLRVTLTLNDSTTEITTLPVTQRNQFFGYYNPAGIQSILLDSGGTGFYPYTLLDNVAIGGPAVLPEPSILSLLMGSLLGFFFLFRNRDSSKKEKSH